MTENGEKLGMKDWTSYMVLSVRWGLAVENSKRDKGYSVCGSSNENSCVCSKRLKHDIRWNGK